MTQLRLAHWRIVHYIDHPPPLEALYELYLNTHRKAREFSREALPMSFFESVQAHCRVVTSVLYDQRGQARSFIFSGVSDTVLHPFAFGRDYRTEDRVNAYYVLHLDLIKCFCSSSTQIIDLGITNYFIKQNFGARLQRNDIYLKFRNSLFNELFGRVVAKRLDIPQPEKRDVFKNEHQA